MRMWLVDPKLLCTKHLGGEHVECHMFLGTIQKKKSVSGYLEKCLFSPLKLKERHDELAIELVRRKKERENLLAFEHASPLVLTEEDWEYLNYLDTLPKKEIKPEDSIRELVKRCPRCAERMRKQVKEYD